jgi:protein TonB
LSSWLAAHKHYPERARQRGDEGTVGIRFTVDAAGRVLDVAVIHSSGSTLLDDAAREMLTGQRVPPFPASMTLAQMVVPVSIRFQLEQ